MFERMSEVLLQLSPTSASAFKSCPLLFKYRQIDRLAEPGSPGAARGSLVHLVLERLFAQARPDRTLGRARALLEAAWQERRDELLWCPGGLGVAGETAWLGSAAAMLENYFKLEDPTALDVSRLEWGVEYHLEELQLRGVIDRLEERRDGSWVLTDYKTGRVPGESRELAASFGLRFYALMCWRAHGIIPAQLRLVYLADPAILAWEPTERTLVAFERQMRALGGAVRKAIATGDWRPRPSPFCLSCSFQDRCPAWEQSPPSG